MGSSSSTQRSVVTPETIQQTNRCINLDDLTASKVNNDNGLIRSIFDNSSIKSDKNNFSSPSNCVGKVIQNMDPKEITRLKEESVQRLNDMSVKHINDINFYSDDNVALRDDALDDIRYIYSLYEALEAKISRTELDNYRKELAQVILDTKLVQFIIKLIVDYPVDTDSGGASEHGSVLVDVALMTVYNYTDASDALAVAIVNTEVIGICQKILEINCKGHMDENLKTITEQMIESCHGILHNVSMREINVERLRQLELTKTLQQYLNSPDEDLSMTTLTTLANIVIEDECDIIAAHILLVARLVHTLAKGMENESHRYMGWSCRECGLAIRNLAKNDANKTLLWQLKALRVLVKLARTGDEAEQCESINAIWALCFDDEIAKGITLDQETGVVEVLVELRHTSENKGIRNACTKCLWTLKDELKASPIQSYRDAIDEIPSISKASVTEGHIMISYQHSDKELLWKIKEKLTDQKYKVWIDSERMGGSTLQAMAEAVENAAVVLLCYSRRYKESDNCRLEAEYAHEQKKPIIPLKMEQGYRPDGWLGIMIGSKYFVEFSGKYSFELKLKHLFREITRIVEHRPAEQFAVTPLVAEVTYPVLAKPRDELDAAESHGSRKESERETMAKIEYVRQWNEDGVLNWLTKYNLRNHGLDQLTGEEIWFLARMLLEAPDQIHRYMRKDLSLKTLLVKSRLVWALHQINRL